MKVEFHVRRNMDSRTRPEIIEWDPKKPIQVRLQTGSAPDTSGRVSVAMSATIPFDEFWASFLATIFVDEVPLSSPRPGVLFLEVSDIPTLVHYPSLGYRTDPKFGGWWTLGVRTVGK